MKILALSIFLVLTGSLSAQKKDFIDELLSIERTSIDKLDVVKGNSMTYISTDFTKNQLNRKTGISELTITKVYYVYTKYKLNPDFNQLKLDRERFLKLNGDYPGLIIDPLIEWEIIEQTKCSSPEEGKDYFHGFILIHRPVRTENERKEEIERLLYSMDNPDVEFIDQELDLLKAQMNPNPSVKITLTENHSLDEKAKYKEGKYALHEFFQDNIDVAGSITIKRKDEWVRTRFIVNEDGSLSKIEFLDDNISTEIIQKVKDALAVMENWEPAYENHAAVASFVELDIRVSYSRDVNGMYLRDGEKPIFDQKEFDDRKNKLATERKEQRKKNKEGSIYNGLKLIDSNEKLSLVMDVTGSMSPFLLSMYDWIEQNHSSSNITSYSFFNDGDNKKTNQKKIRKTGGIYSTTSFKKVRNLVATTMLKGGGGERSECDLEAILTVDERDSLNTGILLIADNYSEIRDLSLLSEMNKKVNVILCAVINTVRIDYLKLVKETKGVLIIDGKQYDLSTVKKDEEIVIEGYRYLYTGKTFKLQKSFELFK